MEKIYNPAHIEKHWYQTWEKANYFSPKGRAQSYCMMLPPPNVTGSLHMGHGFQHTLMDALIRYHRMLGERTLWQAGTDHAGISTQIVVERQLEAEKKTRQKLGRKDFLKRVWQWKETSGQRITNQLRRMGSSIDWSRERFTLDMGLSQAVQQVFIQLYEEGLIYRGKRLINWDPDLATALSDLEVISNEENGFLWYITYPLVDSHEKLIIATTRPETLLGDTAVAVHPEDERYKHFIGKQIHLPLTNRTIPIIGDEFVDPEFGNGCVKITPAHDFNDYEVGKRHRLDLINIFTPEAKLNQNVPAEYQGLYREQAREAVIEALSAQNLLEKIEPHRLSVPRGEKSGAVVEPYLTDQWFVKMRPLAEPAIKAVENQEIKFTPDNWTKTYFQWMHNIEDWCISRQLWWGHQIPAWYDESGNHYVGRNEQDVREKYKLSPNIQLKQDEDVLDTWFSTALWPFSTLGWPEKSVEFQVFYPTNVLITGFDIIFFWVARMIMMALKFTGTIPFKEVYITGLIRDAEGKKMSKSKGNVLDPLDIIDGIDSPSLIKKRTAEIFSATQKEKIILNTKMTYPKGIPAYGTDALRFSFCALANTGRDIHFDLARIEGYRNFCNKLWNAARFVLMNAEEESDLGDGPIQYNLGEQWIISRLQVTTQACHNHFKTYRFDLLANTLYEFVWHAYCDWYLELSKSILYSTTATPVYKRGTHYVLIKVLETLLRLLHPLMPFITEEIWQKIAGMVGKTGDTIMLEPYPVSDEQWISPAAESEMKWLQAIITGIRNVRGEMNITPGKPLSVLIRKAKQLDKKRLENNRHYLTTVGKLSSITMLGDNQTVPPSATVIVEHMEVLIPLAGHIDKDAEINRLNKEINKLEKDREQCELKINNPNFVKKAPQKIVNEQRKRFAQLQTSLERLTSKLQSLSNNG